MRKVLIILTVLLIVSGFLVYLYRDKLFPPKIPKKSNDIRCQLKFKPEDEYKQQGEWKCPNPKRVAIQSESYSLSEEGDWMVIMKPGQADDCVLDGDKTKYRYGLLDSRMAQDKNLFQWSKTGIADKDSPVMKTLMSCNKNTGYIAWNDQSITKPRYQFGGTNVGGSTAFNCWQIPVKENFDWPSTLGGCINKLPNNKKCYSLDAHDKGWVLFDDYGGVLCLHTNPNWPYGTGGGLPAKYDSDTMAVVHDKATDQKSGISTGNGQQLCFVYISRKKLDNFLPILLSTSQVGFQDSYIAPNLQKKYPNITKLMKMVYKQVPFDASKIACMPNAFDTCQAQSQDECSDYVWSVKDGGCGYDKVCNWRYGCGPGALSCKGMNQSFTVWGNINPPEKGGFPWNLSKVQGTGDTVVNAEITSDVSVLAKSGYYLPNGSNPDIWADVIARVAKSNIVGSTWDSQFGTLYKSPSSNYIGVDFSYFNIKECSSKLGKDCCCQISEGFDAPTPKGLDADCYTCIRSKQPTGGCGPYNHDHSKIAIASSNNWCALGGLNRHSPCSSIQKCPQCCRGTTFIMINNTSLHKALQDWMNLSDTDLQTLSHMSTVPDKCV